MLINTQINTTTSYHTHMHHLASFVTAKSKRRKKLSFYHQNPNQQERKTQPDECTVPRAVMDGWKWSVRWRQSGSRDRDDKVAGFSIKSSITFLHCLTCGPYNYGTCPPNSSAQRGMNGLALCSVCSVLPLYPKFHLKMFTEVRLICECFWSLCPAHFLSWATSWHCDTSQTSASAMRNFQDFLLFRSWDV